MKALITSVPMLGIIEDLRHLFDKRGIGIHCPDVVQSLSEQELVRLVPTFDGWIFGDDPVTSDVLQAGKAGVLKAAVKWGIGVDNVDFSTAEKLAIPVANTPNMFGPEVADIAMSYVTALAREIYIIDREVRQGKWPKRRGISLSAKTVGVIGFGNIGQNTAIRLLAAGMNVVAYDPVFEPTKGTERVQPQPWPERIGDCDFLVFTCPLNKQTRHMLNSETLANTKYGVRVVNVSRGAVIDESALVVALRNGKVHSAALEVFENEPLAMSSPLRQFDSCIFGSHNASNTSEAVRRTSERAMSILFELLGI